MNPYPVCFNCNGVGTFFTGGVCADCKGTGFIDVPELLKNKEAEITKQTIVPKYYSSLTAIMVQKKGNKE